jgi:hypothetical protein
MFMERQVSYSQCKQKNVIQGADKLDKNDQAGMEGKLTELACRLTIKYKTSRFI